MIMDGKNYKTAVSLHKTEVQDGPIREHFKNWKDAGVTFVRDGGDSLGVSRRARELAPEYGIDYRTPVFAIHKKGHYGGIVGKAFTDWKEYAALMREAKAEGADFIKIMISGLMEFSACGVLSEEGLSPEEIRIMIHMAHEEGMAVMAHGNGGLQVRAAIEAGVDTLEHGAYLTKETLDVLSESETIWVPTLAPTGNLLGCGRFPDEEIRKILDMRLEQVRYAFGKGAKLGLGSDAGAYLVPHGRGLSDEYAWMCQAVGVEQEEGLYERLLRSEEEIKKKMKRSE